MIAYRQNYAALVHVPRPKVRKRKPILSLRSRPTTPRRYRRKDVPHGDARPADDLLRQINEAILSNAMTSTAFGRDAVGDPNMVFQMREGRRIRDVTRQRIVAYLAALEGEA
jgi:hypothetical protein